MVVLQMVKWVGSCELLASRSVTMPARNGNAHRGPAFVGLALPERGPQHAASQAVEG